jgi:hypothetical protein
MLRRQNIINVFQIKLLVGAFIAQKLINQADFIWGIYGMDLSPALNCLANVFML